MSLAPIDPVPHLLAYADRAFTGDARLPVDLFEAFDGDGRPLGAGPIDRIAELDLPADAEIALHPVTLRRVRAETRHGRAA